MEINILKYLITHTLNKVFGDNLKVAVREKDIYYQVAFQLKKENVKKMFGQIQAGLAGIWKNLK